MSLFGIQAKTGINSNTVVGVTQTGAAKVDDMEIPGQEGDILTRCAEGSGAHSISELANETHYPLIYVKQTVKKFVKCGYLKVMSANG